MSARSDVNVVVLIARISTGTPPTSLLSFSAFIGREIMSEQSRFTVVCPCCEATLNVDAETGALLSHEERTKPLGSFEDMVKDLDKQKQTREQIFAQEMTSFKDRSRLLEEKFQEAKKKAEKDTKVYRNPLDLD